MVVQDQVKAGGVLFQANSGLCIHHIMFEWFTTFIGLTTIFSVQFPSHIVIVSQTPCGHQCSLKWYHRITTPYNVTQYKS